MKYINILFVALAFGLFSCKSKDNASGDSSKKAKMNSEAGIVTANLTSKSLDELGKSDNFWIEGYRIEGNILQIEVKYSGGCKKHEFKVYGSQAIAKSLPPIRQVKIMHNANEDHCRAMISQTLMIDVSNLAYKKEDGNEIYLSVDGIKDRISYKYKK